MALLAPVGVIDNAVFMRILTGKKTGAAWRTKRSGHESIREPRTLSRNALNVWKLNERIMDFIPTQIISKNENDVWTLVQWRSLQINAK
jgi:hypothetical protein